MTGTALKNANMFYKIQLSNDPTSCMRCKSNTHDAGIVKETWRKRE